MHISNRQGLAVFSPRFVKVNGYPWKMENNCISILTSLALGALANIVREQKNGNQAFFIYNQHINYSNICTNLCKFCAFGREKGPSFGL